MRNKLQALAAIPALRDCSQKELETLACECDELHFTPGRLLKQAQAPCNELLIVAEGALIDVQGRHIGPGSVLGLEEMWERRLEPATVLAATRGRVLVMGHAQFRAWKAIVGRPAAQPADAGSLSPNALSYRAAKSAGV